MIEQTPTGVTQDFIRKMGGDPADFPEAMVQVWQVEEKFREAGLSTDVLALVCAMAADVLLGGEEA